ncbi:MAG: hypothetical protein IT440_09460 [Phycisphaeraceae bacterium]|nr:hypothetical protein [Phycisphaeraceae bacterium]
MFHVPLMALFDGNENVFDVMSEVFSRGDTLTHPQDLMTSLQSMSIVWALVFLAAGLACLLHGAKYYKLVVIGAALTLGLGVGYYLGKQIEASWVVAGCFGVLFAVCCWPLMKYAVAIFGGLVGAFIGANAWAAGASLLAGSHDVQAMTENYWIGALIGLILFGLLAFILFKLSLVLFTSFSGSMISVLGGLTLLMQVPAWRDPVSQSITAHRVIIPLIMLVPMIIGLIHQHTGSQPAASAPKPVAK